MRYLLLIYDNEAAYEDLSAEAQQAELEGYFALDQHLKSAGHLVAGEALEPTSTATTVRVRDGQTLTTDGPFAETKEQLGGFYLVQAKDLDEAVGLAARIPAATHGSIEVRPIMEISFD